MTAFIPPMRSGNNDTDSLGTVTVSKPPYTDHDTADRAQSTFANEGDRGLRDAGKEMAAQQTDETIVWQGRWQFGTLAQPKPAKSLSGPMPDFIRVSRGLTWVATVAMASRIRLSAPWRVRSIFRRCLCL